MPVILTTAKRSRVRFRHPLPRQAVAHKPRSSLILEVHRAPSCSLCSRCNVSALHTRLGRRRVGGHAAARDHRGRLAGKQGGRKSASVHHHGFSPTSCGLVGRLNSMARDDCIGSIWIFQQGECGVAEVPLWRCELPISSRQVRSTLGRVLSLRRRSIPCHF